MGRTAGNALMRWSKSDKPKDKWRKWFAWYPIQFERGPGQQKIEVLWERYEYRDVPGSYWEIRLSNGEEWLMDRSGE
jgi:hypothetical protein